MSKAAEKAERKMRKYRDASSAMARQLQDYAEGHSTDDQDNPVSAETLAAEFVGKYRGMGCCLDKSGVSFDGPMHADVVNMMKAAFQRGQLNAGKKQGE